MLFRSLRPNFQPGVVDRVEQLEDVVGGEAAAEVAGGGWIGDALSAEGIEKGFVVAAQFDVFQARAIAHRVVRDVENVIGLVIGQVDFEHAQTVVDGLGQAELLSEQVNRADAAVSDGVIALGDFVINVVSGEGRSARTRCVILFVESALNSGLDLVEPAAEDRFHSKSFRCRLCWRSVYFIQHRKPRKISSFLSNSAESLKGLRLVKG